MLRPFIERFRFPADAHDDEFPQSRIELVALEKQGGQRRSKLARYIGMSEQNPEDAEWRHLFGYAGFRCRVVHLTKLPLTAIDG